MFLLYSLQRGQNSCLSGKMFWYTLVNMRNINPMPLGLLALFSLLLPVGPMSSGLQGSPALSQTNTHRAANSRFQAATLVLEEHWNVIVPHKRPLHLILHWNDGTNCNSKKNHTCSLFCRRKAATKIILNNSFSSLIVKSLWSALRFLFPNS